MRKLIYFFFSVVVLILVSCTYYQLQIEERRSTREGKQPQGIPVATAPKFKAFKNIEQRKHAFFHYLKPGIKYENHRVQKERDFLLNTKEDIKSGSLSQAEIEQLAELSSLYSVKIPVEGPNLKWLDKMLYKVDVLPEALVLIQAANESAWGTSRFAREANNYFGQWCYQKGCGLVPLARGEGMAHEVAKFKSVQQSIHRYFINVNRNLAYRKLREIRYQLRAKGQDLLSLESAMQLTNGLTKYSERGEAYVKSLQTMIRHNQKYLQDDSVATE
ncbi:glucosaminidase domain-containing protein [Vibrio gazogenes]|uniref:Bax protein n=2 Tax=Vibrio gazogenes TaxID=687 RepID=A0A1M4ZKH3_VIBGA|nr:glucosaminidase domain-containing protein [Vibrio gazogenes]USP12386.1 glucosaminidase domain-containing protein [Vibrio gazogenes]SHF18076.1 Bax protein [Vibrio gazogenes DSM 21264] [Vibrio gazogenes DSM 21264 = NBRC 103151]